MEELKFHKRQGGGERKNTQPYDYDFKIKIIQEYLTGGISYKAPRCPESSAGGLRTFDEAAGSVIRE